MRLLTGNVIDRVMRNHADLDKKHWKLRNWERKLYKAIRVKEWKGKMPTFDPDVFDKARHSWKEMAEATCQAETVHTVIFFLSYIPLLFTVPFGSFPVFLITSILASFCDLPFIIMQRFNRDRIIRLMRSQKREP